MSRTSFPSDDVNPIDAVRTFTVPDGDEVIETTGGVLSVTVTVKLPFFVLPARSVALQWTVVVPSGKAEPDAGEQEGVSDVGPSAAVTE